MESIIQDYCQGLIADGEDGSHWVIVDDRGSFLKKKLNIEFLKSKICFIFLFVSKEFIFNVVKSGNANKGMLISVNSQLEAVLCNYNPKS